jgi:hypothetical protein
MDYNNGKLYRIYNPHIEESLEYVGSTCQPFLCTRMAIHRYGYKSRRLKMIGGEMSSYKLFDEYGVDNCIIELLENCPCADRQELLRREGQVTQERKNTVNIRFAGRGRAEYNEIYHRQPHILASKNAYSKSRYARLKATPEGRAKAIAYGKARYARLKAEKDTTNLEEV